jgi:hypothetical protein
VGLGSQIGRNQRRGRSFSPNWALAEKCTKPFAICDLATRALDIRSQRQANFRRLGATIDDDGTACGWPRSASPSTTRETTQPTPNIYVVTTRSTRDNTNQSAIPCLVLVPLLPNLPLSQCAAIHRSHDKLGAPMVAPQSNQLRHWCWSGWRGLCCHPVCPRQDHRDEAAHER